MAFSQDKRSLPLLQYCHSYHAGFAALTTLHNTNVRLLQLKAMAPIDLLIGGSPCNDFSIANPVRQGLEGES